MQSSNIQEKKSSVSSGFSLPDNALNQNTLVDLVYERISLSKISIKRRELNIIVSSILNHLEAALTTGKTIKLRGFGSFLVKIRKGRPNTRNPKTGEIYPVKDSQVVVFKPSQSLKKGVDLS